MPRGATVHAVARLALAGTVLVAVAYQYAWIADRPTFEPANFFSFFTIQSNLLVAAVLAAAAVVRKEERTRALEAVRTGATLFITITGVVFALLLAGLQEELQTTVPWVDFVLHTLVPLAALADWLLDPPRHRLGIGVAAAWLVYPAAWLVYTLVRGSAVDWYPYPFVDVGRLGYGGVLARSLALLVFVAALAAVFAWVADRCASALRAQT